MAARSRQQPSRAGDGSESERQVDQEDEPPASAEDIEVDKTTAQDRPEQRRHAEDGTEHAERLADLLLGEHLAQDPEPLGQHERS